jgi:hypothetical protein
MHCGVRPPWISLATLIAIGVAATTCEPEYPHTAPRLVRVGDGYVAVWEKLEKNGTTLQAAQFSATASARGSQRGKGRTIWDSDELQSRPMLAGGDQSALVLALEGPNPDPDPDKDREDPPRFLTTLALGPDGRELGPRRTYGMTDRICSSPTWDGEQFLVGVAYRLRGFGGGTVLHLESFSADGVAQSEQRIAAGAFWGCAVARHGDVTVVVVTVENPERRGYAIAAYFVGERGVEGPLVIVPKEERMPWPDVVSDPAGGWAIAYANKDEAVRVVRFERDGVRDSNTFDDVDSDTMSLGSNARGVFVSWHERGKIRLRGIDASKTRSLESASRAETAAVGFGDECAIAWSDGKDKYAHLSRVTCP